MNSKSRRTFLFSLFTAITPFSAQATSGEYRLQPTIQQNCQVSQIKERIKPLIDQFVDQTFYDRCVYFSKSEINPLAVSKSEELLLPNFNSKALVEKDRSANCVGLAQHLKEILRQEADAPFQLIMGSLPRAMEQPNLPPRPHVALFLHCRDGVLLVDPTALGYPDPIVLHEDKPTHLNMGFRGRLELKLNFENLRIDVQAHPLSEDARPAQTEILLKEGEKLIPPLPWDQKRQDDSSFQYFLQELTNPDQAVTNHYYLWDRRVLLFRMYRPDEPFYRMILDLTKLRIEYTKTYPTGEVVQGLCLPFAEIRQNPFFLEEKLRNGISQELQISPNLLMERIFMVLNRVFPHSPELPRDLSVSLGTETR